MSRIEIKPAPPHELRSILRRTLGTKELSEADIETKVAMLIRYAHEMRLDLSRNWWCLVDGDIVSACTCLESPGRTAMLLVPQAESDDLDADAVSEMCAVIAEEEARRDVRLLQCLLAPEDAANERALVRAGFRRIATLLYLDWNASVAATSSADEMPRDLEKAGLTWVTYTPGSHEALADLIALTYDGSLDCPFLTGQREMEDVIAGHKAAGRFTPQLWLMLQRAGKLVGCILLTQHPLQPMLEIVYMGVRPECRGQSLGRTLLARGLKIAQDAGLTKVRLAVDERNSPALRLYFAAGFHESLRRTAMARVLAPSSTES